MAEVEKEDSTREEEEDELTRLRYVGETDSSYPRQLKEKSIVSQFGTIRGVKNRVRAGIANYEGMGKQSEKNRKYSATENGKIVFYTTSMKAVRDTMEQCGYVKRLFENMMMKVEERDVFMNAHYQSELEDRLGNQATVPQVFIGGQLLGGAEKLEELNERGQLKEILADFERIDPTVVCELCGGHNFISCTQCLGSKKGVRNNFAVLRCTACNEAGLMKCPMCNTTV
eukprot:m.308334 g.308334  ORF g.308334 m.308334 type:complete len:228 (+) comp43793_c0_seq1:79-762(+)